MIRSMTGYGRAQSDRSGWRLVGECRSVNHRGLDVRFNMPSQLSGAEPSLRELLRENCQRGRVEVRLALSQTPTGAAPDNVLQAARALSERLTAIQTHTGASAQITISDLLAAGLRLEPSLDTEALDDMIPWVNQAVSEAVLAWNHSRSDEGERLRVDLEQRLGRCTELITGIEAAAASSATDRMTVIRERLDALLADLAAKSLDETRLLQEVAISLDKSDITEEIVRARSHIEALQGILAQDTHRDAVGKRLDFFLQELFREANTMGSKSASAELTKHVVDLKAEIERLREQAQNIE
ncbi:MAG: YicC family protein [Myxococcales bacterium]|nr:YicC family protein [Myxococcales bacterium]